MKYLRKITAMLLVFALCAALTVSVSAENTQYKNLLVLGDSISTGYGLSGYSSGNPYSCASYGNRLAADLGLSKNNGYVNKAVNGDMSKNLLALLPSLSTEIEKADLIVISIGGNDYLQRLTEMAKLVTGNTYSSRSEAYTALMGLTKEQMAEKMKDPTLLIYLNGILTEYSQNLDKIIANLKEVSPSARVIFLKQYNPAAGVDKFAGFDEMAAIALNLLNQTLETSVKKGGYELADVPSVIDCAAAARTNILLGDIHPNAAGHGEIYKLLLGMVKGTDNETSVTAPEAGTTEAGTSALTTAAVTTAEVTDAGVSTDEAVTEAPVSEEITGEDVTDTAEPDEPAEGTDAVSGSGTDSESTAGGKNADGKIKLGCNSSLAGISAFVTVLGTALVLRKKH